MQEHHCVFVIFDFCSTQTTNSALLFLFSGEDEQKFARNNRVKQTKPNYPALGEIRAFAENRRKSKQKSDLRVIQ